MSRAPQTVKMGAAPWLFMLGAIALLMPWAMGIMPMRPALGQEGGLTAEDLREGGYVIFFRHVAADDGADLPELDVNDCMQQRNIREPGLRDARTIGDAFRALRIPVGTVYASEYCRAQETAQIAFRQAVPVPALDLCCADTRPITNDERLRYIEEAVKQVPPAGLNTVIVGHGVGMMTDLGMGEAAIYKPDGRGGSVRVARVLPGEWLGGVYAPGGPR